jgi:hypothetical protein
MKKCLLFIPTRFAGVKKAGTKFLPHRSNHLWFTSQDLEQRIKDNG